MEGRRLADWRPRSISTFGSWTIAKPTPAVSAFPEPRKSSSATLAAVCKNWRQTSPLPLFANRSEEHTSELQSHLNLVCRLLLEKKKKLTTNIIITISTRSLSTIDANIYSTRL